MSAWLFTGQGAQYVGMGKSLYEAQPFFRETLDACDGIYRTLTGQSILARMWQEVGEGELRPVDQTCFTQPALFCLEYALASLLASLGPNPIMWWVTKRWRVCRSVPGRGVYPGGCHPVD